MTLVNNRIGTEPGRVCLRCGASAYVEAAEGCAHAYTIEELAPEPRVEIVQAGRYTRIDERTTADAIEIDLARCNEPGEEQRRERMLRNMRLLSAFRGQPEASAPRAEALYLASHNGAAPCAIHPTEAGARRLFAERWVWGQALAALFRWLHRRPFRGVRYLNGKGDLEVSIWIEGQARETVSHPDDAGLVYKPRTLGPSTISAEAEAIAAIDREIERAVVGTEGETVDELAARLFDRSRREGDADVTHGPGVRPWEHGDTRPDPRDTLIHGRLVVRRKVDCRCGANAWASLPQFGVAGWYVCTVCRTAEPDPRDALAIVPEALRAFEVHRRGCVVRSDLGTQCPCGSVRWLVRDPLPARGSIDAKCANRACDIGMLIERDRIGVGFEKPDETAGIACVKCGASSWTFEPDRGVQGAYRCTCGYRFAAAAVDEGNVRNETVWRITGVDRETATISIDVHTPNAILTERERGELLRKAMGKPGAFGGVPLVSREAPAEVDVPAGGPESNVVWPVGTLVRYRDHVLVGRIRATSWSGGPVRYRVAWEDGTVSTETAKDLRAIEADHG